MSVNAGETAKRETAPSTMAVTTVTAAVQFPLPRYSAATIIHLSHSQEHALSKATIPFGSSSKVSRSQAMDWSHKERVNRLERGLFEGTEGDVRETGSCLGAAEILGRSLFSLSPWRRFRVEIGKFLLFRTEEKLGIPNSGITSVLRGCFGRTDWGRASPFCSAKVQNRSMSCGINARECTWVSIGSFETLARLTLSICVNSTK